MALWLCKSEPDTYSYADLVKEKKTLWTGVANPAARLNMRKMAVGDRVFFYHTGKEKAIVGEMVVTKGPHQDPNDQEDGKAVVVEVKPVKELKTPVSLSTIKADASLADWELVKLPRLSVMSVNESQWKRIEELSSKSS